MILDHIVIENFGAFRGRQEAELTTSPGRPIVLFGGMNGGGKTTLLDAIQLAFYGPKPGSRTAGAAGIETTCATLYTAARIPATAPPSPCGSAATLTESLTATSCNATGDSG